MDRNIIETHVILLSRTRRRNTVTGTSKETEMTVIYMCIYDAIVPFRGHPKRTRSIDGEES